MKVFTINLKMLLTICVTILCIQVMFPRVVDAKTLTNFINSNSTQDNLTTISNIDESTAVFNSGSENIHLSENDIYLMAQVVYGESRGEPYEGKVAVASVILNRVVSNEFPNTVNEVIFQPKAFSCVVDGSINVIPTTECFNAVYDAIYGYDPTGEAVFFYNPSIATCSWMQSVDKTDTISIGQHLFFNIE